MLKNYIIPEIEVVEYRIEEGYAASMELPQTEFIGDVSLGNEEVIEGEDYNKDGWDENNWY